jgi:putative FmdB family regulatory protein
MPTYEYKCTACGHTFEKFQSIMAEPIKRCPVCGKAKAKRLISAGAGLIFKGSGFYITDYRDAGYKDSAKADSDAGKSGGEGGGGESKSESKADSKGDPKGESKSEGKGETKSAPADGAGKSSAAENKAAAPKPETKSPPKGEGKSSKKKH